MKHPLTCKRAHVAVLLCLIAITAALSAGRPSQAAPQAMINVKLSGPMLAGGKVYNQMFAISADSRYAVYLADPQGILMKDIYSVRTDGQDAPIKLSNALG